MIKRKIQIDHVAEGLASLGFSDLLASFPEEMKPIFVGGVKNPSLEELLSHLDLIVPDSKSGEVTYEYLQQYLMDLDETGRLVREIATQRRFVLKDWRTYLRNFAPLKYWQKSRVH